MTPSRLIPASRCIDGTLEACRIVLLSSGTTVLDLISLRPGARIRKDSSFGETRLKYDLECHLEYDLECDLGTGHLRNSNDGFGRNLAGSENNSAIRRCALLHGISVVSMKVARRIDAARCDLPDGGARA
jgi:hypothetical protein